MTNSVDGLAKIGSEKKVPGDVAEFQRDSFQTDGFLKGDEITNGERIQEPKTENS